MGKEIIMDTSMVYTTGTLLERGSPIYPHLNIEVRPDSSTDVIRSSSILSVPLGWRYAHTDSPFIESFIGILSDEEAIRMKGEINSFKKRFDNDLANRSKILFGE